MTNLYNVKETNFFSQYVGIYGVGKAAIHQPALTVLSHKPEGATKNIAWCGKGIVYDTGGLSIKEKVKCLICSSSTLIFSLPKNTGNLINN